MLNLKQKLQDLLYDRRESYDSYMQFINENSKDALSSDQVIDFFKTETEIHVLVHIINLLNEELNENYN